MPTIKKNKAPIYNNCTPGCHFCTVRRYWLLIVSDKVKVFMWCRFFGGHKWKIGIVRGVSATRLDSSLKNQAFFSWNYWSLTSGMYYSPDLINIYTLSTNRNKYKTHTAVTPENFIFMKDWWRLWGPHVSWSNCFFKKCVITCEKGTKRTLRGFHVTAMEWKEEKKKIFRHRHNVKDINHLKLHIFFQSQNFQ